MVVVLAGSGRNYGTAKVQGTSDCLTRVNGQSYKCSLPTGPRPVFMAPIFALTISDALPFAVRGVGTTALIELEIAFVMARDLRPGEPSDAVRRQRRATAQWMKAQLHFHTTSTLSGPGQN